MRASLSLEGVTRLRRVPEGRRLSDRFGAQRAALVELALSVLAALGRGVALGRALGEMTVGIAANFGCADWPGADAENGSRNGDSDEPPDLSSLSLLAIMTLIGAAGHRSSPGQNRSFSLIAMP